MDAKYWPHTNLFTIASDMKYFLLSGYQSLPFVLGGTFLILGLYTAQFSMLFFLIGYLVLTPLLTLILNWFASIVIPSTWNHTNASFLLSSDSDICNMLSLPSSDKDNNASVKTIVTPWLSMVAFFLGYIGMNAYSILNKPVEYPPKADEATKKATDNKAMLRRTQVTVGIVCIAVLAFFVVIMRTLVTKCDSIVGGFLSSIFVGLGVFWYMLLSLNNNDRLSDLFGIANRLLVTSALNDAPYACLASD
jgi:hypothetical protein